MRRLWLGLSLVFILACGNNSQASTVELPNQVAVASAHPLATDAGIHVLQQGGNAFDAAIAVAAVLGVVEPYSAGMGGGGFWLLRQGKSGKTVMVDARETAPSAAFEDLYLDPNGQVDRDKAINSALSAGIPGQAAAMEHLAKHYGKLNLSQSLRAAIDYAENGFPANPVYLKLLDIRKSVMNRYPHSKRIFMLDGKPIKEGQLIKQKELAATLRAIAKQGAAGFYSGPVAKSMVNEVRANGGIWRLQDLANYKVIEREPIKFNYHNATIWSAAPPSSGGVALAQMFGMLSNFNLALYNPVDHTHLLAEVMRRAYRDRALYLGDPDFVSIPLERILKPSYLENLSSSISLSHATPSKDLGPSQQVGSGTHTTHFSIIDKQGNMVAATLSINLPFGSGVTLGETGILLNNEMDDFSAQPGSPNAYGLIGSEANAIAPGKRPLSSMTPTFMEYGPENNRQTAIIGTPGGSRIITMVFLGLLEALADKKPQAWVDRPRFHHQYFPDQISFEPEALSPEMEKGLQEKGHVLKMMGRRYGDMHAIRWYRKNGTVEAGADQRRLGSATVAD